MTRISTNPKTPDPEVSELVKLFRDGERAREIDQQRVEAYQAAEAGLLNSASLTAGNGQVAPTEEQVVEGFANKARAVEQFKKGATPSIHDYLPDRPYQYPTPQPRVGDSHLKLFGTRIDGMEYVLPSMVGGKQRSFKEAVDIAKKEGLERYPSFDTVEEANDWAKKNHATAIGTPPSDQIASQLGLPTSTVDAYRKAEREAEATSQAVRDKTVDNHLKSLRRDVPKKPLPGLPGKAISLAGQAIRGAGQVFTGATKAAVLIKEGEDAKSNLLWQVADNIERNAGNAFPTDPSLGIFNDFANAIGSSVGFLAGGLAAKGIGRAAIGGKGRGLIPFLSIAGLGGLQNANQEFENIIAMGGSDEKAWEAFVLGGFIGGTEAAPFGRLLSRINRATGGTLIQLARSAAVQGVEESFQEGLQTVLTNTLIAKRLYDPERGWAEGLGKSILVGGVTGGFMDAIVSASTGGLIKKARDTVDKDGNSLTQEEVLSRTESAFERARIRAKLDEDARRTGTTIGGLIEDRERRQDINVAKQEERRETQRVLGAGIETIDRAEAGLKDARRGSSIRAAKDIDSFVGFLKTARGLIGAIQSKGDPNAEKLRGLIEEIPQHTATIKGLIERAKSPDRKEKLVALLDVVQDNASVLESLAEEMRQDATGDAPAAAATVEPAAPAAAATVEPAAPAAAVEPAAEERKRIDSLVDEDIDNLTEKIRTTAGIADDREVPEHILDYAEEAVEQAAPFLRVMENEWVGGELGWLFKGVYSTASSEGPKSVEGMSETDAEDLIMRAIESDAPEVVDAILSRMTDFRAQQIRDSDIHHLLSEITRERLTEGVERQLQTRTAKELLTRAAAGPTPVEPTPAATEPAPKEAAPETEAGAVGEQVPLRQADRRKLTRERLDEFKQSVVATGRVKFTEGKAQHARLTKAEQFVMDHMPAGGIELGFIVNPLRSADPIRKLPKLQKSALLSLLDRDLLRIVKEAGTNNEIIVPVDVAAEHDADIEMFLADDKRKALDRLKRENLSPTRREGLRNQINLADDLDFVQELATSAAREGALNELAGFQITSQMSLSWGRKRADFQRELKAAKSPDRIDQIMETARWFSPAVTPPVTEPAAEEAKPAAEGVATAKEPWQMTRKEYRSSTKDPGSVASAVVIRNVGSAKPGKILRHYQAKYPELNGVTIGGLRPTKKSGPLDNHGVARIVFDDGKFVPDESQIHLTKNVSPDVVRHEIEHLLDVIHGAEMDPSKPSFTRFSHDEFSADYAHRASIKDALSEGKPVPAEVLAEYPDLAARAKPAAPGKLTKPQNPTEGLRKILTACTGKKCQVVGRSGVEAAKRLYTGQTFLHARSVEENYGTPIAAILSAKHGVPDPDEKIATYDKKLPGSQLARRKLVEHQLPKFAELLGRNGMPEEVYLQGSKNYRDLYRNLIERGKDAGLIPTSLRVVEPSKGAGIGTQKSELATWGKRERPDWGGEGEEPPTPQETTSDQETKPADTPAGVEPAPGVEPVEPGADETASDQQEDYIKVDVGQEDADVWVAKGAKDKKGENLLSDVIADQFQSEDAAAKKKGRKRPRGEAEPKDKSGRKTPLELPIEGKEVHQKVISVADARSGDDKSELRHVKIEGDKLIATNGHMILIQKGEWGKGDGLYKVDNKGNILAEAEEGTKYPDVDAVIPDIGEAKARINIDNLQELWRRLALADTIYGQGDARKSRETKSDIKPSVTMMLNPDQSIGFHTSEGGGIVRVNVHPDANALGAFSVENLFKLFTNHARAGDTLIEISWNGIKEPIASIGENTIGVLMPLNLKAVEAASAESEKQAKLRQEERDAAAAAAAAAAEEEEAAAGEGEEGVDPTVLGQTVSPSGKAAVDEDPKDLPVPAPVEGIVTLPAGSQLYHGSQYEGSQNIIRSGKLKSRMSDTVQFTSSYGERGVIFLSGGYSMSQAAASGQYLSEQQLDAMEEKKEAGEIPRIHGDIFTVTLPKEVRLLDLQKPLTSEEALLLRQLKIRTIQEVFDPVTLTYREKSDVFVEGVTLFDLLRDLPVGMLSWSIRALGFDGWYVGKITPSSRGVEIAVLAEELPAVRLGPAFPVEPDVEMSLEDAVDTIAPRKPTGDTSAAAKEAAKLPGQPDLTNSEPLLPSLVSDNSLSSADPSVRSEARIQADPIKGRTPKPRNKIFMELASRLRRIRVSRGELGALGLYYPGTSRTTIRYAGDLDVTAHELAHRLDHLFGIVGEWAGAESYDSLGRPIPKKSPFDEELRQEAFDTTTLEGYRLSQKRAEWVAEYLRAWMINPAEAEASAPKFTEYWKTKVPENIKVRMREFGDEIRIHAGASGVDQTVSNIDVNLSPRGLRERAREALGSTETGGFTTNLLDRAKSSVLDALAPLWKGVEYVSRIRGLNLMPGEDPQHLARLFSGFDRKFWDVWIDKGPLNSNFEEVEGVGGLDWILEALDGSNSKNLEAEMSQLVAFMVSQRVVERGDMLENLSIELIAGRLALGQANQEVSDLRLNLPLLKRELGELHKQLEKAKADAAKAYGDPNLPAEIGAKIDELRQKLASSELRIFEITEELLPILKKDIKRIQKSMNYRGRLDPRKIKEFVARKKERMSGAGQGRLSDYGLAETTLAEIMNSTPEKRARLEEGARRYRAFATEVLRYARDMGRITNDQFMNIRARNKHYVSMRRLFKETDSKGFSALNPRKIAGQSKILQRFEGSSRQIANPIVNLMMSSYTILRDSDRNNAMVALRNMLTRSESMSGIPMDLDSVGSLAREGDKDENGDPAIKILIGGKPEYWIFQKDIALALKDWNTTEEDGLISKFVQMLPQLQRSAITHSPPFMARNLVRDVFFRSIVSRVGSKPWSSLYYLTPQGVKDFQSDVNEFYKFGGGMFGHYGMGRNDYNRRLKDAIKEVSKTGLTVTGTPRAIVNAWSKLAGFTEILGRVTEFRKAREYAQKKLGYNRIDAGLWAAYQARDLTDFARAGKEIRRLNKFIPFTNAAVQGLARTITGAREHPLRFAAKWATYVLGWELSAIIWNWQNGDEEEWGQLPSWQKDYFWNYKVGGMWVTIPKPWELGVMGSGVSRAYQAIHMNDERAFEGWFGSIIRSGAAVDEQTLIGPLKVLIEPIANWDFFRRRNIVPAWESSLDVKLRSGTKFAPRLAQIMQKLLTGDRVDARKIQHMIESQFGGLGRIALRVSDIGREDRQTGSQLAVEALGMIRPPPTRHSRDISGVLKTAEKQGRRGDPDIKSLRNLLGRVYESETPGEKAAAGQEARRFATSIRRKFEEKGLREETPEEVASSNRRKSLERLSNSFRFGHQKGILGEIEILINNGAKFDSIKRSIKSRSKREGVSPKETRKRVKEAFKAWRKVLRKQGKL